MHPSAHHDDVRRTVMSRATTLFVATDDQLVRLFGGVRHALSEPITSLKQNPLMRRVLADASWDPGEHDEHAVISTRDGAGDVPSIYAAGGDEPIEPIVAPESRNERVLEETAPLRLRALPHAAVLGISGLELEMLTVVLTGDKRPPPRIVDTDAQDGFVDGLPTEALMPLALLANEQLDDVLTRWNAALSITRRKVERSTLLVLRELAREAIACGGHLFTHMPS
jgi:hypothetical protein